MLHTNMSSSLCMCWRQRAMQHYCLAPGVAVFSRRALPLAAWTNGLEIAAVKADVQRSCLILETGVNQRWRYGGWKPSPDFVEEAEGWEEAKEGVK